jgi:hypothetical protein
MMHLQGAPRRAPFSDWIAQVSRIQPAASDPAARTMLQAYYNAGLSPREAADDLGADR